MDFNGSIEMLQAELASLKNNLHSDCIRWQVRVSSFCCREVQMNLHSIGSAKDPSKILEKDIRVDISLESDILVDVDGVVSPKTSNIS